jgi:hypothetical protein
VSLLSESSLLFSPPTEACLVGLLLSPGQNSGRFHSSGLGLDCQFIQVLLLLHMSWHGFLSSIDDERLT